MPPKKPKDDVQDKICDAEDERLLTIQVTGTVSASPHVAALFLSLVIPDVADQPRFDVKETEFQHTIFTKKISLASDVPPTMLSMDTKLCVFTGSDAKLLEAKAKPLPKRAAKEGAVQKDDTSDFQEQLSYAFSLHHVFLKTTHTINVLEDVSCPIFSNLSISISCNVPLMSASHLVKFMPTLIEIIAVEHLPPPTTISLKSRAKSVIGAKESETLRNVYDGVSVKFRFMAQAFSTRQAEHENKISFRQRFVSFLSQANRLQVIQELFFSPLVFEVHDRDAKLAGGSEYFGTCALSLRPALSGFLEFSHKSQVVPHRGDATATPVLMESDYLSSCTTLLAKVNFLAPLPRIEFVNQVDGQPVATQNKFLSRLLIVLPYKSADSKILVQSVMGALVQLPSRAKGDVRQFVTPQVVPLDPIVPQPKATKQGGGAQPASTSAQQARERQKSDPSIVQLLVDEGISGFEVMDGNERIIVIEGPQSSLSIIAENVSTVAGNNPAVHVIFNSEVMFPKRAYFKFPPLVQSVEAGASHDSQAEDEAQIRDELDSGGVGGRIRRIRLAEPIPAYQQHQSSYLRQALPTACLSCVGKLCALRTCSSMVQALDRDAFPSAEEIIALERIAGCTLETFDVCGADSFYSFSSTNVDEIVAQAIFTHEAAKIKPAVDVMDFRSLENFIGRVVSFTSTPATSDEAKRQPSLQACLARYPNMCYMVHLGEKLCLPCAFNGTPPSQSLRFEVTAQVVQSGIPILFVMSCLSLAKHGTDCRNATYDDYCRKRKSRQTAIKTRRTTFHATKSATAQDSSDDDFVDAPPDVAPENPDMNLSEDFVRQNMQVSVKRRTAVKKDQDYSKCIELWNTMQSKESKKGTKPVDSRPPFLTANVHSAAEDHKHRLAPSAARVDDLKQPWSPPMKAHGLKEGERMMVTQGARELLRPPFDSIFAGSETQRAAEEEEDARKLVEDWKEKVVVRDTHFKVSSKPPKDVELCALAKQTSMLTDPPQKYSLKMCHVPPVPASIHIGASAPHQKPEPNTQFYYGKQLFDKIPVIPALKEEEKGGPLWGANV